MMAAIEGNFWLGLHINADRELGLISGQSVN